MDIRSFFNGGAPKSGGAPKMAMVNNSISKEIQQLQIRILELEKIQEENAKILTFEYIFQKIFDFIQMKKTTPRIDYSIRKYIRFG